MTSLSYQQLFTQIQAAPQPDWLAQVRAQAWQKFASTPWPTRKTEHYKYVHLKMAETVSLPVVNTVSDLVELPRLTTMRRVVLVDGYYCAALSDTLPAGVTLTSFSPSTLPSDKWIQECFAQISNNLFAQLNTALWTGALWLNIAAHTRLDVPLHIVLLTSQTSQQHIRLLITAQTHSESTIFIEHQQQGSAPVLLNYMTQVQLAAAAKFTVIEAQAYGPESIFFNEVRVEQSADSAFTRQVLSCQGKLIREDLSVQLQAAGAVCELQGLYWPRQQAQCDHHLCIEHNSTQTSSTTLYKGIISDQAQGIFNGKIKVKPQAQKTAAELRNHNLLLSNTAEIDTKPELDIEADDVKCAHGATVGQLDEQALFYLQARGITRAQAVHMLTQGFLSEVLAKIESPTIKNYLTQHAMLFNTVSQDYEVVV